MKKNNLLFLLLSSIPFFNLIAQKEISYFNPPAIHDEKYSVELQDIISNESLCKLKVSVQNKSNEDYLVYFLQKSGFEFENMGKYYEKKEKGIVVAPSSKESSTVKVVNNDFRMKRFKFYFEGLYLAKTNTTPLDIASIPLVVGEDITLEKNGVIVSIGKCFRKKR